jgi:hypothetical protein
MQGHSISAAAVVPSASGFLDGYALLALVASGSAAPGQSGARSFGEAFPSYFPDQIPIEALDSSDAVKSLIDKLLNGYIGANPSFVGLEPS